MPDDASLVIAIHTDYGATLLDGFGIEDALGHVDIYPNGGDLQPGCEKTRLPGKILTEGISEGEFDQLTS